MVEEVQPDPLGEVCLALRPPVQQVVPGGPEAALKLGHEGQGFPREDSVVGGRLLLVWGCRSSWGMGGWEA